MLSLKQNGAISLREATKKEISENNRSEKKGEIYRSYMQ